MKKLLLLVGLIVLAGCTTPPPYRPQPVDGSSAPPSTETRTVPPSGGTGTTNTLSRDASDCERQAALSTAGNKAEAFNNCMKARRGGN